MLKVAELLSPLEAAIVFSRGSNYFLPRQQLQLRKIALLLPYYNIFS